MAEMPEIDPNFEPQSRPRLGTWPLNRPNIQARRNRGMEMGGTFLDVTLEEANSQELIAGDASMVMETPPLMKDDYLSLLSPDTMLSQTDLDSVLLGSPPAPNLVTDFSALSGTSTVIKPEPSNNTIVGDYCTTPIMTELSNLDEGRSFTDTQTMQKQNPMQIQTTNTVANFSSSSSSLSKSPTNTVSTTQSTSGVSQKAKSSRKNAWGNMSYADLITQAIEASPEKRLTLAQIYEWMVKNVAYFKDKGDSNSSAGWKNSIRHNLSLHAKFKRIQNEGTGKSSWWVINHDAKPGKSPRRPRAISMDNASAKYNRSRSKVLAKQKADLLKKQKGLTSGLEATVSKALGNEYRQRASSNASSIGGRISPQGRFLTQDLEDDGAPPLSISSPLSGSANNLALSSSLPVPSAFNNIFDMSRQDATSTIPEAISPDRLMHENLLESLASMDVVSSPGSAYSNQTVMQQMNGLQNSNNLGNSAAQNSPNLASLLQKTPSKVSNNKILQKTTTKAEPQWNDSKGAYPYPEYQNQQLMSQVMQSPPQYKSQMQSTMGDGKPLYHYLQQPQDNSQYGQQVNYISQGSMPQYMTEQQSQQMVPTENTQTQQYQSSNLLQMSQAKFPSDINLDNQELYDSGDLDMIEVLRDMPTPDYSNAYNFGMEFESGGKPASFYNQIQNQMAQESGTYNAGMSGNAMLQQQQSQQPAMHPNPDIFIANPGNGATSMDMMMEGCRMNNTSFQRMQGSQQPPSVGTAPSYSMQ